MFTRSSGTLGLALLAALAIILAACSAGPSLTQAPSSTPGLTAGATATATSSALPSVAAGPIAEGTYRSETVAVATIIAKINADTTLTAAQKTAAIQGFSGHQTSVVSLDFHNGQFTESSSFDGAPLEVGARATYAFPDDHTLVIQEACCGISTFDLTTGPSSFMLKYRANALNAGEDIIGQTIYELSPFTLVP